MMPTSLGDTPEAPEQKIAFDLVRRALPVAPVWLLVCAAVAGGDGAASAGFGLVLVLCNFLLAGVILGWAARISVGLLMGASLFGYLIRLGLIFVAVLLVKDESWVSLPVLGVTIIVAHLGLLAWELRFVSASLAFPSLKPNHAPGSNA